MGIVPAWRWNPSGILTALCGIAAVGMWAVFWPGFFSPDSLDQIRQAMSGRYDDWHPPLLAALMAAAIKSGLGVSGFILVQCVAGVFAVRYAFESGLQREGPAIPAETRTLWTGVFLVLILSPGSPLPFYLATFWKDTAVLILLAIIAGMVLARPAPARGGWRWWLRVLALAVVMSATVMMRHNTLILMPIFMLLLWRQASHLPRAVRAGVAAMPLVLLLAAWPGVAAVLEVEPRHQENSVMALDLVGVIVADENAAEALPHTAANLEAHYREGYRFADVGPLLWESPRIVRNGFVTTRKDDRMREEYLRAVVQRPLLFGYVKVRAFVALLGLDQTHLWTYQWIEPNELGLAHGRPLSLLRRAWGRVARSVAASPLRWFGGVHAVWLVIACLLFVKPPGADPLTRASFRACSGMALAYYASYLVAAPARDFRFMYPATLLVQVLSAAAVVSGRGPLVRNIEARLAAKGGEKPNGSPSLLND